MFPFFHYYFTQFSAWGPTLSQAKLSLIWCIWKRICTIHACLIAYIYGEWVFFYQFQSLNYFPCLSRESNAVLQSPSHHSIHYTTLGIILYSRQSAIFWKHARRTRGQHLFLVIVCLQLICRDMLPLNPGEVIRLVFRVFLFIIIYLIYIPPIWQPRPLWVVYMG